MIKVAASGYFDPLHVGHIEYLKLSRKLGDYLIVLVNTDQAAVRKKGFCFMPLQERMEILASFDFVDEVLPVIDKDDTVSKTLELLKPDIFCKGGDRTLESLPASEVQVCQMNHIQIITNLGKKIQSSSRLTAGYVRSVITMDWGYLRELYCDDETRIRLIGVKPDKRFNYLKPPYVEMSWLILKGKVYLEGDGENRLHHEHEFLTFPGNNLYIVENSTADIIIIQETQTGSLDKHAGNNCPFGEIVKSL